MIVYYANLTTVKFQKEQERKDYGTTETENRKAM